MYGQACFCLIPNDNGVVTFTLVTWFFSPESNKQNSSRMRVIVLRLNPIENSIQV